MATPAALPLRLYELAFANGRVASPFAWRIRYALAYKGLPFESVPVGFTEIPALFAGRFKTVPILEQGPTALNESWDIALYLDRTFPGTPLLFSNPKELAMVRLFDGWFSGDILRRWFRLYVLDIYRAVRPEDRAYFRESREARIKGRSLEDFTADREAQLPAVREALAPLRAQLSRYAFLGGDTPNYADFIALGGFHWVASVSTLPPLEHGDSVLRGWLERGFDLYQGIGRDERMRPLFA
ncbi:MAG TPA: glutathione S-transferase N-terminal domain-containing protein [Steroidobacteraceae bacterium]|nr:glutathione S-transferase N-terminal domain-containing protein [Steroidobacteraceae bacterium]